MTKNRNAFSYLQNNCKKKCKNEQIHHLSIGHPKTNNLHI